MPPLPALPPPPQAGGYPYSMPPASSSSLGGTLQRSASGKPPQKKRRGLMLHIFDILRCGMGGWVRCCGCMELDGWASCHHRRRLWSCSRECCPLLLPLLPLTGASPCRPALPRPALPPSTRCRRKRDQVLPDIKKQLPDATHLLKEKI